MGTLADQIEAYLKSMLAAAAQGLIEIRRSQLAERFACAPSQINYVLETRFTPDRGFYVESRRGGGGFIRIGRLGVHPRAVSYYKVQARIGHQIGEREAEEVIADLQAAGELSERKARAIRAAVQQETSWLEPPLESMVRAMLLKALLLIALQEG